MTSIITTISRNPQRLKKPEGNTFQEEAECPRKESAWFFAVQLTCLIGVVLDECFCFDKSIDTAEREGGKHDEDYDYSYRGGHYKFFRLIRPSLEKGK